MIELQHFDGTIEEIEAEDWLSMRAKTTSAPEDWSGSVDISNEDVPGKQAFLHMDWLSEVDALETDDLSGDDLIND